MRKSGAIWNERSKSIPSFTPALVQLGWTLTDQARFGWEQDRAATYEAALRCTVRALAADPDCGEAYTVIGYVRIFQRRHDEALEAGEKAVALCPNGRRISHDGNVPWIRGRFRASRPV